MHRLRMQLTLSMDVEHQCKLELFLSTQLYEWCISEEDTDSTSMDELLLEAGEMFEMSQATSPDSYTLLLHVDPYDLLSNLY